MHSVPESRETETSYFEKWLWSNCFERPVGCFKRPGALEKMCRAPSGSGAAVQSALPFRERSGSRSSCFERPVALGAAILSAQWLLEQLFRARSGSGAAASSAQWLWSSCLERPVAPVQSAQCFRCAKWRRKPLKALSRWANERRLLNRYDREIIFCTVWEFGGSDSV